MKVGLFFGSFNPIHVGHMIIANYMAEFSDLDEVWFIITPQSPFKQKSSMLSNHHRLAIANIAMDDYPKLKTSDIEFKLPQPNYTINTLVHIEEKFPDHHFCLIMGEDNLKGFHKWKNYELFFCFLQTYFFHHFVFFSVHSTLSLVVSSFHLTILVVSQVGFLLLFVSQLKYFFRFQSHQEQTFLEIRG